MTDLGRLGVVLRILFGLGARPLTDFQLAGAVRENAFWLALAVVLCAPVRPWLAAVTRLEFRPGARHAIAVPASLGFLLASVTLLVGSSYNPFIYFRF